MNLNEYMEQGISSIASALAKFYLTNSEGSKFLLSLVSSLENSAKMRENYEKSGHHIPPFLIASIASQCNLRCAGCYARADGMCAEGHAEKELRSAEWNRVFSEASDLGISFILLAGGEPLLRREIVKLAADYSNIVFPIFTNGTLLDEDYLNLFEKHRNLIPVFSIEGEAAQTDLRRGEGVSKNIENAMKRLLNRGILFAASITVTNENLHMVVSESFLSELRKLGCGAVFFVEYVPAEKGTEKLILSDLETEWLNEQITKFKAEFLDMSVFAFPGDEKYMGGCLAAGRGFFHISPFGSAEACPFSPYSHQNMKDHSILEVLESSFFQEVREISKDGANRHMGGCTLFNHEDEVRKLLR